VALLLFNNVSLPDIDLKVGCCTLEDDSPFCPGPYLPAVRPAALWSNDVDMTVLGIGNFTVLPGDDSR
jgi:hypothetical protein